jgi:putative transposase
MPLRGVSLVCERFYHIYNRGVNRGPIFFCEENWSFFLRQMEAFFKPDLVEITAYCLMPTHYHLLVLLKTDNFSELVMQPFATSYSKAVNRQNKRVGPLFQGRFQAKRIEKDSHLLQLSRYLHLNPVKAGLVEHPSDWLYSSYRDYLGIRKNSLVKPGIIIDHFSSVQAYQVFVEDQDQGEEEVGSML